jgi:restriction endonuclease S subunit
MELIGNFEIIIPPLPEQQAIASFLDRETTKLDSLISKVESAIDKLKEYRTALISAVVTGKIDVSTVLNTGVREAA